MVLVVQSSLWTFVFASAKLFFLSQSWKPVSIYKARVGMYFVEPVQLSCRVRHLYLT